MENSLARYLGASNKMLFFSSIIMQKFGKVRGPYERISKQFLTSYLALIVGSVCHRRYSL
jgi:hypothetical protein